MTRTDAQFVRRPAQNFMTGQNLQNPPLDIFDVTMNPDQFFGGSGTGTFNQQFEGSVRRPGLGSGNPNLGDVKSIMIGIRNPETQDDLSAKSVEIWVNELRLTDLNLSLIHI